MSVLKTFKLGKVAPTAAPADAKSRARAKVIAHLEQQKRLLGAQLEGKTFEATRPVYRTNEAGERVRVMQPVHVRRDWFEDTASVVHFMLRYGSKPLPLDKAGNSSVEVGKLDALLGVIDTLLRRFAPESSTPSSGWPRRSAAKRSSARPVQLRRPGGCC